MITENLNTLNIHKLTQEQYNRELLAGNIDENALYFTTDNNQEQLEDISETLNAIQEELDDKADAEHNHDDRYYTESEIDSKVNTLNNSINGKATKATTLSGYGIADAYTKAQVDSALDSKANTPDSSLSTTSTNPVQNKVITNWLGENVKEYALQTSNIFADGSNRHYLHLLSSGVSTAAAEPDDGNNEVVYGERIYAIKDFEGKHHKIGSAIDSNNMVPISDGNGYLVGSSISATTLGYLSGVTSNIQTQLNEKVGSSHNHSASNITSGTLGVARGGTGATTHTSNAVLTGNGTSAVKNVATASGALYATAANGAAQFGTLPVAQGGTGGTSASAARTNLSVYSKAEADAAIDEAGASALSSAKTYADGLNTAMDTRMDAAESKLSGIDTGANKTTVDTALSSTSTNPVQNKVINSALSGKVPTSRTINGKALDSNITLNYSDVGADQSGAASSALDSAKSYADEAATKVKNDLLNGAGGAYDTLKELGELIDTNKDAIDVLEDVAAGKANASHTHGNITNAGAIGTAANKAVITTTNGVLTTGTVPVASGGTGSTTAAGALTNLGLTATASELNVLDGITATTAELNYVDGVTSSIQSQLDSKASSTTVSNHIGDSTHISSTERTNWNAAKTHADTAHAPSNAEKNQNAFSNVTVGDTTIAADSVTDTLTLIAGSNVTITPDATNDNITIAATDTVYTHPTTAGNKHIPAGGSSGQVLKWSADGTATWGTDKDTTYSAGTGISFSGTTINNSGVRTISTGTANGTISVNTNGSSANVAVKGLGSAAYTDSTAYASKSQYDSLSSTVSTQAATITSLTNRIAALEALVVSISNADIDSICGASIAMASEEEF